jgi:hypothetical protein
MTDAANAENSAPTTSVTAARPALSLDDWFASLTPEHQAVVREDKWMLARAAFEAGRQAAALIFEGDVETSTRFHLEWIAGARPPAHPSPMTGKTTFGSFEDAVDHMRRQAEDAKFVSLVERVTVTGAVDRSDEVMAICPTGQVKLRAVGVVVGENGGIS